MKTRNKLKFIIFKKLNQLLKQVVSVFLLSIIIGSALYVSAAFVNPRVGPASSTQDFAENILGANTADNEFDSSLVASSSDGSIIELLEYVAAWFTPETSGDFDVSYYESMHNQIYDDWNCSANNAIADGTCADSDAEYTGEESTWASTTDTDLGTETIASGNVKRDMNGVQLQIVFKEGHGVLDVAD